MNIKSDSSTSTVQTSPFGDNSSTSTTQISPLIQTSPLKTNTVDISLDLTVKPPQSHQTKSSTHTNTSSSTSAIEPIKKMVKVSTPKTSTPTFHPARSKTVGKPQIIKLSSSSNKPPPMDFPIQTTSPLGAKVYSTPRSSSPTPPERYAVFGIGVQFKKAPSVETPVLNRVTHPPPDPA